MLSGMPGQSQAVQWLALGVSALTFGGLVWYVIETYRIRLASQRQLEAMRRPCLVVCGAIRDPKDAVMRPGCALLRVAGNAGLVAIMNIGNGPAFNAEYQLSPLDDGKRKPGPHFLVHVLNDQANPLPIPTQTVSDGTWSLALTYESISGRCYKTETTIDSGDLITVEHREVL